MMHVRVYTTPTCGECKALIQLLQSMDLDITILNMADPAERTEALCSGMMEMSMPVLEIGNVQVPRRLLVGDAGLKIAEIKELIIKITKRDFGLTIKTPGQTTGPLPKV